MFAICDSAVGEYGSRSVARLAFLRQFFLSMSVFFRCGILDAFVNNLGIRFRPLRYIIDYGQG